MNGPERQNLVIVRAGNQSLHYDWLDCGNNRNWDLVVSRYTEDCPRRPSGDSEEVFVPGGKWNGLYQTFEMLSRPIGSYRYIWLPDDDIATYSACIDGMFEDMARYDLLIAQPALSWDSFYTYPHTLRCHFTHVRYTDMVELMMPCFASAHLAVLAPHFADTATGWGLDWIWCRTAKENANRYAVLDKRVVRHTRPLGVHLYKHAESVGENASRRMEAFMARFPDVGLGFKPTCYAAVTSLGIRLGLTATCALLAISYARFLRTRRRHTLAESVSAASGLLQGRKMPNFNPLHLHEIPLVEDASS